MTSAALDPDRSAGVMATFRGVPGFPRELAKEVLNAADLKDLPGIRDRDRFVARLCATVMASPTGPKQLLVIDGGYPLMTGTPHGVARRIKPEARCVYVDRVPQVTAYIAERLRGAGVAALYWGSLTTDQMMPAVWKTLDRARPVQAIYVTDLAPSESVVGVLSDLRRLLPLYSEIVVVNGGIALNPVAWAWNQRMERHWYPRHARELGALCDAAGIAVAAPGVRDCARYETNLDAPPPPTGFLFARLQVRVRVAEFKL